MLIGDKVLKTDHQLILRSEEEMLPWRELEVILNKLKISIEAQNFKDVRELLIEAVPGYQPKNSIDDLMFIENQ